MQFLIRFLLFTLVAFVLGLNVSPSQAQTPDGAFGSVAISASNVAYAGRWNTILAEEAGEFFSADCSTAPGLCDASPYRAMSDIFTKLSGLSTMEQANAINAAVNRAIIYTSDAKQHGSADYWALAQETLTSGRGDCEDVALLKMWMLRAAGFPAGSLHLVLVKDTRRGLDHAVLLVQMDGRSFVLDSLSDIISQDSDLHAYEPVVSLSSQGAWIHGFRQPTAVAQN